MAASQAHVSLYVSRELRVALEQSAVQNDRSLSAEVRVALRAYTSSDPSAAAVPQGVPHAAEGKGA